MPRPLRHGRTRATWSWTLNRRRRRRREQLLLLPLMHLHRDYIALLQVQQDLLTPRLLLLHPRDRHPRQLPLPVAAVVSVVGVVPSSQAGR